MQQNLNAFATKNTATRLLVITHQSGKKASLYFSCKEKEIPREPPTMQSVKFEYSGLHVLKPERRIVQPVKKLFITRPLEIKCNFPEKDRQLDKQVVRFGVDVSRNSIRAQMQAGIVTEKDEYARGTFMDLKDRSYSENLKQLPYGFTNLIV